MYREVSLIAHTRRTLRSANQSRGGRLHLGVRSKSLFSAFKSAKFLPSFYCFLSISSISLARHRYSLPLFILSLFPSFLTKTPSRHFLESFDSRLMNRRWILFKKWKNLENCRIVREPSVHLEIKCRSPFQPVLSLSPVSVFIFAKREEVAPRSSLSLFALTRLHETRSFSAHSSPAWLFTPVAPLPPFPSLPNTFPPRPTPHPFRNKSQFSSSLSLSLDTNKRIFVFDSSPAGGECESSRAERFAADSTLLAREWQQWALLLIRFTERDGKRGTVARSGVGMAAIVSTDREPSFASFANRSRHDLFLLFLKCLAKSFGIFSSPTRRNILDWTMCSRSVIGKGSMIFRPQLFSSVRNDLENEMFLLFVSLIVELYM